MRRWVAALGAVLGIFAVLACWPAREPIAPRTPLIVTALPEASPGQDLPEASAGTTAEDPVDPELAEAREAFYTTIATRMAEAEHWCGTAPIGLACGWDHCAYVGGDHSPYLAVLRRPGLLIDHLGATLAGLDPSTTPCERAARAVPMSDARRVGDSMCLLARREGALPGSREGLARWRAQTELLCAAARDSREFGPPR